ncbi:MAG: hypothetical protein CVV42_00955 [Candidatus Riflebacteria bacterium HGW-Riflebacteria-2]|jgi:iron(III) transport system permease protein|nr:MAG: hypothetical protein CVV42_00955 [Candidatus Riflebacteria bacterium HGW-Riflebacteria-2]
MAHRWDPATGYYQRTLVLVILVYLLLTLLPLTLPFLDTGWKSTTNNGPTIKLLGRSLQLASLSACIAVGLGLFAGIGLWHAQSPVYRLRGLVILSMLLPPYLLIQGWMSLAWSPPPGLSFIKTPAGLSWAALILGTSMAPLAAVLIGIGRCFIPLAALESLALQQGTGTALRRVAVPAVLPLLAAAWLIIAMLCLLEGGVPLSLQFPVFATEITSRFLGGENPVALAKNVWPLYFCSLLLGICALLVIRRCRHSSDGNTPGPQHFMLHVNSLPAWFRLMTKTGWLILSVLIALPLSGLLRLAFTGSVYNLTMNYDGMALLRSLLLALASACLAALLVVPTAAALAEKKRSWLLLPALLPLALPASITGITWAAWGARMHACCRWLPEITPLLLSHLGRIMPFALLVSLALWSLQQRKSPREAVFMHRHHFWQRIRVEWPHYLLVFMVAAVFSLRELEISLLTVPPGGETLPIRVFNLLHYGAGSDVARLSLLLAVPITIAALLIAQKWEKA